MSESESHAQPDTQDTHAATEDLMCLTCGYNLRGLPRSGSCPECGLSILETLAALRCMTKRDAAMLAFRVSALCFFLSSASALAGMVYMRGRIGLFDVFLIAVSLVFASIIPGLIWLIAPWLAVKAIRQDGIISVTGLPSIQFVIGIASSVLGLLYLIYGIQGLIYIGISYLRFADSEVFLDNGPRIAVQLLIGAVLIGHAKRIGQLIAWLRTAGLTKSNK